ncbi:gene transfer agent family protein [Jannaschia aquimarina]|uniref:Phage tail tube protein, GTA-gp10 n=1 Tax=Jannaschia aquimarina TaxID=935700 RepID=A0A0D1CR93_9RHOB|nr:gene transfer agent family protein [Jannaschia aquimarina]KIT17292.1 hypothetical protein jaqu_10230 [Jannaschia aquimarina]SNT19767.1 Phage tail tube protein, GTA-gp10 [Jannaschia aquimarina]
MSVANPWSGQVALTLDGDRHVLRLTLGANLENEGLVDLVSRFERGRFGTRDVISVLLAGLRGGGWSGSAETLLNGELEGGPVEATRVAAELLGRAFALPGASA